MELMRADRGKWEFRTVADIPGGYRNTGAKYDVIRANLALVVVPVGTDWIRAQTDIPIPKDAKDSRALLESSAQVARKHFLAQKQRASIAPRAEDGFIVLYIGAARTPYKPRRNAAAQKRRA